MNNRHRPNELNLNFCNCRIFQTGSENKVCAARAKNENIYEGYGATNLKIILSTTGCLCGEPVANDKFRRILINNIVLLVFIMIIIIIIIFISIIITILVIITIINNSIIRIASLLLILLLLLL